MVKRQSLRLLVVGATWPLETFLARLFDGLSAEGVSITFASDQKPDSAWFAKPGREWQRIPGWDGPAILRLSNLVGALGGAAGRDVSGLYRLGQRARNQRTLSTRVSTLRRIAPFIGCDWDVVYFPWNAGAIAYSPLFDLGIPIVVSCRGAQISVAPHNPDRAAIRNGLRTTLSQAMAVHCVSLAMLREAMQFGLPPERARVIYPAVDPAVFYPGSPSQREAGPFRIVTTGSLIWRKGYEYALLAIKQLVDSGVQLRFDIIGDGPERQRILYTIDDLGLRPYVKLHGRLTPDEVVDQLQCADAFVLASLSEGISNAALEAMACAVPVITTDCGGMREAVDDGVEGYVVPARDPTAMALVLKRIASDSARRQQMGQNGRARVLRQFSLSQQIAQFHNLLQDVMQCRA